MFAARGSLRTLTPCRASASIVRLRQPRQGRRSAVILGRDQLKTTNELSERLDQTELWNYGKRAKKGVKRPKADRNRVHIVSEKLCDDVIEYIRPSLQRHVGCDLLDLNPGAGLWSAKLHEALQPRTHILLEPDMNVYAPFLEPLLEETKKKKGDKGSSEVTLLLKSGVIWSDLSSVLNAEYLPHQTARDAHDTSPPQKNDTLLVTANLAIYPRRKMGTFDSVAQLVIYQFLSSIRTSALFQQYGLVRMLLWIEANDRRALLAHSCQERRRLGIESELSTEYIMEVAGPDKGVAYFVRDQGIDDASTRRALRCMEENGVAMPEERQPQRVRDILEADKAAAKTKSSKKTKTTKTTKTTKKSKDQDKEKDTARSGGPAEYRRVWRAEMEKLQEDYDNGVFEKGSEEQVRLQKMIWRSNHEARAASAMHSILGRLDEIAGVYEKAEAKGKDTTTSGKKLLAEAQTLDAEWNAEIAAMVHSKQKEITLQRDNERLFYQEPPVMNWDRRTLEPLVTQDEEFFPNAPCCLVDIQPKAMHPLLLAMGPKSSRAGDMFEFILRGMLSGGTESVSTAIETVWPGAAEGVLPNCPSLYDRKKGGSPVSGYGETAVRTLNEHQWTEILEAWMQWPFRPTFSQLVSRISDDGDGEVDDDLSPVHTD